jgi:CelD/BcsL family acetyltransferase involved in cellulose biosynthesis
MLFKLTEAPTRLFKDPVEDKKLLKKKSLKRHYNYFARNGRLECKNCKGAEEILNYMNIFFQQHIERRAMSETRSQFLDEREKTFYEELVKALAPTGWLVFSVVLFNDRPLAFHLGFEYAGRFIWYKPTFNVEYSEHSPGEVLIKYLFEYALERGLHEFDFAIGEETFKYRFANHIRVNYEVRIFRHRLRYYIHRSWLQTKALIKRYPSLANPARALLRSWKNFRSGVSLRRAPVGGTLTQSRKSLH